MRDKDQHSACGETMILVRNIVALMQFSRGHIDLVDYFVSVWLQMSDAMAFEVNMVVC